MVSNHAVRIRSLFLLTPAYGALDGQAVQAVQAAHQPTLNINKYMYTTSPNSIQLGPFLYRAWIVDTEYI
jgi:hypothetical protein